MLSRVADNLYWMSRYLERAEHAARLLDVNLNLMLDESASSADRRWRRVLAALGNPPNLAWSGDAYQVAQILTFDPGNRSSITACCSRGPGECAPGTRRDQLRPVAASEPSVSPGDAAQTERD